MLSIVIMQYEDIWNLFMFSVFEGLLYDVFNISDNWVDVRIILEYFFIINGSWKILLIGVFWFKKGLMIFVFLLQILIVWKFYVVNLILQMRIL